jgi:phage-related protein
MFTTITANGIDAFETLTGATTGVQQNLLSSIGDLMMFRSDVPAQQWAVAIRNAFSGQKKSLQNALDINITDMLGRDWGDTPEQIAQDFIDLADAIGVAGMMGNSMSENINMQLSNMSDIIAKVWRSISDTGVFDKLTSIVSTVAQGLNEAFNTERVEKFGQVIADSLTPILNIGQAVANAIASFLPKLIDFLNANPQIAKMAILLTTLSGAFLVIGGAAFKVIGSFAQLAIAINYLQTAMGGIGTVMKVGATKIIGALAPLTLSLGLMYLVWKNDLFGIRTSVTTFVQNVVSSFQKAKTAVSGSLSNIQGVLKQYDTSHSFFDGLTLAITRVMVLAKALSEGWNDFTLSEDTYLKAKELGILPLIEAIFDLKYRFDNFKEGFIQGWQDISTKVQSFVQGLADKVDGTIFENLLEDVTGFFQALSNNDADAWYQFGYSFAEFTAKAIAFWAVFKVVDSVIGKIVKVATAISGIAKAIGGVSKVGGKLISGVQKAFPYLTGALKLFSTNIADVFDVLAHGNVAGTTLGGIAEALQYATGGASTLNEALVYVFGSVATTIAGIVSVIGGAVLAVTNFVSQWKDGFNVVKAILMTLGVALVAVGAIILGAPALIAGVVAGIVALVANLVIVIHDHWEQIKSFFGTIADWINQNVLQPIVNFFSPVFDLIGQMWESFSNTVQHVIERVKGFIDELIAGVQSIWDNIMSYITPAIETFNELKVTFQEFCSFIGQKISGLWTGTIQPVLSAIGNFFSQIFTAIYNTVSSVWNAIWGVISPIVMSIWNTIQSVFTSIFDTIMNVMSSIWQGIVGVVNGIVTFIGSILNGIWQTISNVMMAIMNAIMGKTTEAQQNLSNALNAIKSIFTGAWNGIKQIVTSVLTAISNVISSVWNGIKDTFSTVLNGIKTTVSNVFNGIKTTISNVMNNAVNLVTGAVSKLKSAFNFKWSLPSLKLPHISVSGGEAPFGIMGKGSLPKFSISWYKEGGIFNKPSVIGVGEAGTEAVMPLENNTEWIGTLAKMITSSMTSNDMKATNSSSLTPTQNGDTNNQYLTNNNTAGSTNNSTTDNSVTFNAGAIQITAQNSSDAEAENLAKKIMSYIQRQQELKNMLAYN